ncbi:MAG: hypothetical protein AB7G65_05225 [Thermoleophilia bacterium]
MWGFAENLYREPSTIDREVKAMARSGAQIVRTDLDVTPAHDAAVKAARRAGLRVLGVVTGGSRDPAQYADRIHAIVRHYAPMGVHLYEIWNEPNLPQFWPTADEPDRAVEEYMRLVRAAYPRIKAADSHSVVLVGALSRYEAVDGRPNDWIEKMYELGLKGNFDAISLHPYTFPAVPGDGSQDAYAWEQMTGPWDDRAPSVRESMIRHGDGARRIWITEFGAPTGGKLGVPVSEERQAEILRRATEMAQTYPWLGGFIWYSLRDAGPDEAFGVLRLDWTPKAAYGDYVSVMRRTAGVPAGAPARP